MWRGAESCNSCIFILSNYLKNASVFLRQIEDIEVRRKEKELVARVQLPADAQAYQIRQVNDHLIMMIFGQLLNNINDIWTAPKKKMMRPL